MGSSTGSAPAANPSQSSGGEVKSGEPQKMQKEIVLPFTKSEIGQVQTIQAPEAEIEPVKLTKKTADTLTNTIAFNIPIIEKMANPNAFLTQFVKEFKQKYPKVDFSDKKALTEAAQEYVRTGGTEAFLVANKLLEWEGSVLQSYSGAFIKEEKAPKSAGVKGTTNEELFSLSEEGGLEVGAEIKGSWKNILPWNWGKGTKTTPEVVGKYALKLVKARANFQNITDQSEQEYLEKCGWSDNLDLHTDLSARKTMATRLRNIAQARTEIFLETGLKTQDLELNFIDEAATGYLPRINMKLRGDTGPGYLPNELAEEGKNIIDEIRNKTKAEIKKKQEKSVGEKTAAQLRKKIDDIKTSGNKMDDAEKQSKQAEIQVEIDKLDKELKLFTRKTELATEIPEAQANETKAKTALDKRVGQLSGYTAKQLLDWSDDNSNPQSWTAIKAEYDSLVSERNRKESNRKARQDELKDTRANPPNVDIDEVDMKDEDGKVTATKKPNQKNVDRVERWNNRIKKLEDAIDKITKSIEEDPWPGAGAKSLDVLISEKEQSYTARKLVVEDNQDTKTALDTLRASKKTLSDKKSEEVDVNGQIAVLTGAGKDEKSIRTEIKTKKEAKEKVGGVGPDEEREIKSLEILADILDKEQAKTEMEERLQAQEYGEVGDLLISPEFANYPKVVLQTIKLMFGDDALTLYGANPELAKKAKSLLESRWYMQIIVEEIENDNYISNQPGAMGQRRVDWGAARRTPGGPNVELTAAAFNPMKNGKRIETTLNQNHASRDAVKKIIDRIGKSALGVS